MTIYIFQFRQTYYLYTRFVANNLPRYILFCHIFNSTLWTRRRRPSVDDPYPARCVSEDVYDSECKDDCTSFDWCIAYGASHDGNECWLITSTGSCPNGWACHCTSATGITAIATQSSDLIPSGLSGYNCMAKGI